MVKEEIKKLQESFRKNKDRVLIIDSLTDREFLYRDIEDLSLRLASFLKEKGLNKGDKAAIFLPNCIEFVLLYFACMQTGIIPIPINQKLKKEEIAFIISNSDAKCIFTTKDEEETLRSIGNSLDNAVLINPSTKEQESEFIKTIKGKEKYKEVPFDDIEDDDVYIISYTSGTTKQPKGVVVSYKGVIQNGLEYIKTHKLNSDSRFYQILSLAYMAGFYNLLFVPSIAGGSVVIDKVFGLKTAYNFWKNVKDRSINVIWMVPSIVSAVLKFDRSEIGVEYCRSGNMQTALVGTAPLSRPLKRSFEEKYNVKLYENYGSTEALFISTNSPSLEKVQGVGKPLPGCEVRIMDGNNQICSPNKIGHLKIITPQIMKGYYKNEEETSNTLKDGVFHTGDTGFFDEEGYLHIAGREKDLIIRGGINISPKEVEDVIGKMSLVNEVAVIGIPDELKGEEVAAAVCAKEGISAADIRKHCKEHLADFKIPKQIFFLKEFPRSATGKVQKNNLKEQILAN